MYQSCSLVAISATSVSLLQLGPHLCGLVYPVARAQCKGRGYSFGLKRHNVVPFASNPLCHRVIDTHISRDAVVVPCVGGVGGVVQLQAAPMGEDV
jgi:hypothetical protein